MIDPILIPVIDTLRNDGASEEYIADAIADVTTTVTVLLYKKAMETFTDEEIQAIDACSTEEEANKKIAQLFYVRVGLSTEAFITNFLGEYVKNFKQNSNA